VVASCAQAFTVCGNVFIWVFPAVACIFDKGERYIEENEHANSVSQSVVRFHTVKSY